ncbi:MAG: ISAs1 family transposase [Cyanobacteria bacterium J06623_5]
MCVKGNQKTLYEGINAQLATSRPIDVAFTTERGHGRQEHRLVSVYDGVEQWQQRWPGIARMIGVYRCGYRDHRPYRDAHYYISDLSWDAQQFSQLVRGHWSIENQLHWPKDVVLGEDTARQKTGDSPANWSFVRNIFVNLARRCGFTSLAKAKRFFANRPRDVLLSLT